MDVEKALRARTKKEKEARLRGRVGLLHTRESARGRGRTREREREIARGRESERERASEQERARERGRERTRERARTRARARARERNLRRLGVPDDEGRAQHHPRFHLLPPIIIHHPSPIIMASNAAERHLRASWYKILTWAQSVYANCSAGFRRNRWASHTAAKQHGEPAPERRCSNLKKKVKTLKGFFLKIRPESRLHCLICAIFARQRCEGIS